VQDLFPLYSDVEDIRRVQAAHEFVTDQLRSKPLINLTLLYFLLGLVSIDV